MKTELKMVEIYPGVTVRTPQWPDDAKEMAERIDEEEKDRWKLCGFVGKSMMFRRAKK